MHMHTYAQIENPSNNEFRVPSNSHWWVLLYVWGWGRPPPLAFLHRGGSPYVDFLVGLDVIEILLCYDVFLYDSLSFSVGRWLAIIMGAPTGTVFFFSIHQYVCL